MLGASHVSLIICWKLEQSSCTSKFTKCSIIYIYFFTEVMSDCVITPVCHINYSIKLALHPLTCANPVIKRKYICTHRTISIWSVSAVKTVPSLFGHSTTRTLEAWFLSSDSGSRFCFKLRRTTLMIWPMGGRVVDRERACGG